MCVCVCVCVCVNCFCFIVLEETHLFDEARPHSSKDIQGLFCVTHPTTIESHNPLEWNDGQKVCWGECRYTEAPCGKRP